MTSLLTRLSLGLSIVLLSGACARNPVTGKRMLSFMSTKQEISLGQGYDPQVQATFGVYEDQKLQQFLTEKGMAMAKVSHRPDLPWQFKVVDSPVVNAFAVPGGFVYFTRGILAHFNSEAQFAGVLGHEIGHVTARHGARQQTGQILGQLGLIIGMVAAPELAQYADIANQGMGLLFLKFGRDHETQSDKLGVEYSTKIGYDAVEMASFFGTLKRLGEKSGGGDIPTFLSTHPDPGDRERLVNLLARATQQKTPGNYVINRDGYLNMIEGIIYGDDPKQGFVENNMFYHPELKFQFSVPTGWVHQNSPIQFEMASKDGKAMMLLTLAQGSSLEQAAQATVQQYSLKVLDSKRGTIDGNPALILLSERVQQQQGGQAQGQNMSREPRTGSTSGSNTGGQGGQPQSGNPPSRTVPSPNSGNSSGTGGNQQRGGSEQSGGNQPQGGQQQGGGQQQADPNAVRVMTYLIQYNGAIYAIHGLTYAALFNQYAPEFERTATSFRRLTDPDKINRQPERIRVKKVARTMTFTEAMNQWGMPATRLGELSILNGIEQNATVLAGTLLKTIGK
jgi:predicted Zn-dependent protease